MQRYCRYLGVVLACWLMLASMGVQGQAVYTPPSSAAPLTDANLLAVLGQAIVLTQSPYLASGSTQATTGSITSAGTSLVVASGIDFAMGQGVSVAGAGAAGVYLTAKITAISGTTLTLDTAAGTTVAGAVVRHDNTAALQAALDACNANHGGTIYVPAGTYYVAGTMRNTSAENSRLLLPSIGIGENGAITVRMIGAFMPSQIPSVIGTLPSPFNGTTIFSLGADTSGSLIGGKAPAGNSQGYAWTMVNFQVENMAFRVSSSTSSIVAPTSSGLDLRYVAACRLNNVVVDAGTYSIVNTPQPTNTSATGVYTPLNNNGAYTQLDNVMALGFYTGIQINEHTNATSLNCQACYIGLAVGTAHHSMHIKRYLNQHCTIGISFVGSTGYAAASSRLSIEEYDIERETGGAWRVSSNDINDPSNYGKGTIQWAVVTGGVGASSTFYKTGGATLTTWEMGTFPVTSSGSGTNSTYPTTLSNVALLLQADYGVTTSGTSVTAVTDQSPNANNATGPSGKQPTLQSGVLNSHNIFNFVDTSFQGFTIANSASLALAGDKYIAAVIKTTDTSGYIFHHLDSTDVNGFAFGIGGGGNTGKLAYYSTGKGSWAASASTINDGAWHLVEARVVSGALTLYVDTVSVYSGTGFTNAASTGALAVGGDESWPGATATGSEFGGSIAEIVVRSTSGTTGAGSEQALYQAYAKSRYGLTGY